MSAMADVLKAVRETIVMNERVTALTERMDTLSARMERITDDHGDLRDRVTRVEAFFEVIRPVILNRVLPAPDRD